MKDTFFRACFSDKPHRRSKEREQDRTETNTTCTRKVRFRLKCALFCALSHNGFGDAHFARNYCAYNDMDFMSRDTRYNVGDFGVSLLRIL